MARTEKGDAGDTGRYCRSMTDTPDKKHTWITEWVRSETFWRDVTSKAFAGIVSGLVLAGLAAVAASMSGLLQSETATRLLLGLACLLLSLTLVVVPLIQIPRVVIHFVRRRDLKDFRMILTRVLLAILGAGASWGFLVLARFILEPVTGTF